MNATPAALSFRLPVREDAAMLLSWRRLPEVTSNSFTDIDDDLDKQRAWIDRCGGRDDYIHRIIQVEGVDVGYTSITITQPHWGVGSIGTYMGDRRGRTGIGALNFAPVLNHCFYTLGLRKLVNQIFADNDRVRKGQTMLGYRHVGVLRAHAVKNNVPRDVHLFEMLAEDWTAIRPRFGLMADMDGRVW